MQNLIELLQLLHFYCNKNSIMQMHDENIWGHLFADTEIECICVALLFMIYMYNVNTSNFNVMPKIGHISLFKKCITSNCLDIVCIIYSD